MLRRVLRWTMAGQLHTHLLAYARLRLRAWRLARSAAFDAAWYRAAYPDVAIDPARHYLLRGRQEGRAPLPVANPPLPALALTDDNYRRWIAAHDTLTEADRASIRVAIVRMARPPHFSLVMADPGHAGARDTIASVRAQLYPHWELLTEGEMVRAKGDFVLFLSSAVRLAETALFELAAATGPDIDLLYADEDRIDPDGVRHSPWFKPDWDPDMLASTDFLGPTACWRRSALPADHPRTAGASLGPGRVRHVPVVLFHRATPPAPVWSVRIAPPVSEPQPLVSVIVPTRDRARLLARCAHGVLNRTDYRNIELLIVDNDSRARRTHRLFESLRSDPRVRVLAHPGAFDWSAMNNRAVREANGAVVVLLNNDIEVIDPHWLDELMAQAMRPDIGAVGATLLYPDRTIQHAGIALLADGGAAHLMRHADAADPGPFGELRTVRTVGAVTGACLALRRELFLEVGGIEPVHLPVTGNDIDLCLRLRARGYRVVVTPHARLVHLEAASRGLDVSPAHHARLAGERAFLLERWGDLAARDPYLNPNLTVIGERPVLASSPGEVRAWRRVSSASLEHSYPARPRAA